MKYFLIRLGFIGSLAMSLFVTQTNAALHDDRYWKLSEEKSKISYASIKKNSVGENNHFKKMSGHIDKTGNVTIDIDVTSVETFIDIRNQRTIKYIFDATAPKAILKAKIDLQEVEKLTQGQTATVDTSGTLTLSNKSTEIETSIFIARLSDNRVLVTSNEMIMVKTADLGVDEGVNKLMELAKLSSITRVVPISLRMIFDRTPFAPKQATTTSTNAVATSDGNIKAGKKLYRQCQACHQAKKEANGVGPHLVALNGRKAGSIDKYIFSSAVKDSGVIWDTKALTSFLTNPQQSIPGNKMPFAGIKDSIDVKNLVAYLQSL